MRRFSTLLGLSLVLASPALRAQSPPPAALAACLTCHGAAAEALAQGPGVLPVPRVAGQHAEYLAKQLREFKAGTRKSDLMAPLVAQISRSQLKELAAHLASQAPVKPAVDNLQQAGRGRAIYEEGTATVPACVGCHMQDGVGTPRFPKLAGQRPAYVVQQLTNFKHGVRTNDRARVMRNIASNLSDEDMTAIGQYLASLQRQ